MVEPKGDGQSREVEEHEDESEQCEDGMHVTTDDTAVVRVHELECGLERHRSVQDGVREKDGPNRTDETRFDMTIPVFVQRFLNLQNVKKLKHFLRPSVRRQDPGD